MNQLRATGVLLASLFCAPFLGIALAFLFLVTMITICVQTLAGKQEWDFTQWWNPKTKTGRDR